MCVTQTRRPSGYDYVRKALDEARAKGATDQELVNVLSDAAKSSPEAMENLLSAYRATVKSNDTDLRAAIESVLFPKEKTP